MLCFLNAFVCRLYIKCIYKMCVYVYIITGGRRALQPRTLVSQQCLYTAILHCFSCDIVFIIQFNGIITYINKKIKH